MTSVVAMEFKQCFLSWALVLARRLLSPSGILTSGSPLPSPAPAGAATVIQPYHLLQNLKPQKIKRSAFHSRLTSPWAATPESSMPTGPCQMGPLPFTTSSNNHTSYTQRTAKEVFALHPEPSVSRLSIWDPYKAATRNTKLRPMQHFTRSLMGKEFGDVDPH